MLTFTGQSSEQMNNVDRQRKETLSSVKQDPIPSLWHMVLLETMHPYVFLKAHHDIIMDGT